MHEAANKQYKVLTASAAILVLGDTEAYNNAAKVNEGFLHLGVMSKQEYDQTVDYVTAFYENRGEAFKREEAFRNASLSAMLFMLIAKERGWDTCPMIGFAPDAMRRSEHPGPLRSGDADYDRQRGCVGTTAARLSQTDRGV